MSELDGRVAVITGGARGQGRAHAVALAHAGADIVVCDLDEHIATVPYPLGNASGLAETAELVEQTGRRCAAVTADVRSQDQMNGVADRALEQFGRIDILLANAGIATYGAVAAMDERLWQDMIDVNLTGVYHSCRAVVPHMIERRWGRIVATSSIAAKMAVAHMGHYTAAKWGVVGLVKALSLEVAKHGITVNAILPDAVDTEMINNAATYRQLMPTTADPTREDIIAMVTSGTPNSDWIAPAEIAETALLLVSERGRHFNGEVVTVSAGRSANTV